MSFNLPLEIRHHLRIRFVVSFLLFTIITSTTSYNSTSTNIESTYSSNTANLQTGIITANSESFSASALIDDQERSLGLKKLSNLLTSTGKHRQPQNKPKNEVDKLKNQRKQDENLSMDCVSKRNEILHKLQNSPTHKSNQILNSETLTARFQRLRPKQESNVIFNDTLDRTTNIDNEHVPQCTHDGFYEPIQCHKIGYCWCVNKFGQAIKNSATSAGQKPFCQADMYESESNGLLVVTGVSERRLKNILKSQGSNNQPMKKQASSGNDSGVDSTTSHDNQRQLGEPDNDFERRVSTSKEPSLALVPNECSLSELKARERASNFSTDGIWIPRCDSQDSKLYAEKQCHTVKSNTSICWCVNQITGLPLSTSFGKPPNNINCTEIKKLNGIESSFEKKESSKINYSGFSDLCNTQKRIEFVLSLMNQFKLQIHEYLKINPTFQPPENLTPSGLHGLNDTQIAEWKFATLDTDMDGKLDNVEWLKFRNNFKLIDKAEDSQRFQKSKHFPLTPLSITRVQRRCWRDFLLYCGNGILSTDEPISISSWLSCTELPNRSNLLPLVNGGNSLIQHNHEDENYESLKAAVRSKHKNPFLGILKPD